MKEHLDYPSTASLSVQKFSGAIDSIANKCSSTTIEARVKIVPYRMRGSTGKKEREPVTIQRYNKTAGLGDFPSAVQKKLLDQFYLDSCSVSATILNVVLTSRRVSRGRSLLQL